jgi:hypothetical protein
MSTVERIARDRWNAQADEHNQWDMLGGDEQVELMDAEYKAVVAENERLREAATLAETALKCTWREGVGECYHTQNPHTCPVCKGTGKKMKTTKSGSIAVGAPMSLARLQQELEHYIGPLGNAEKLIATDEGENIVSKWLQFKGGQGTMSADAFIGGLEWSEMNEMHHYLYGALVALRYSMAGRVTLARSSAEQEISNEHF